MNARILLISLAAAACAGLAFAQAALPPGLSLYVAAGEGRANAVSLGVVRTNEDGQRVMRQRRQLGADSNCAWPAAPDVALPADDAVALRNPAEFETAAAYGAYYADLVGQRIAARGGAATPVERACVNRTLASIGASVLQSGQKQPAPGAERPE